MLPITIPSEQISSNNFNQQKSLHLNIPKNSTIIQKVYTLLSKAKFYQFHSERLILLKLPQKTHSYIIQHLFGKHRSSLDGVVCLWSPDCYDYHVMEKYESYSNHSHSKISFFAHNSSREKPNSLCYIHFQEEVAEIIQVKDLNLHSKILKTFQLNHPNDPNLTYKIFTEDLIKEKIRLIRFIPQISIPFCLFQGKDSSEVIFVELQKTEQAAESALDQISEQWRIYIKKSENQPWSKIPIEFAQRLGNGFHDTDSPNFFAKFKDNKYQTLFLSLPYLNKTYSEGKTCSYITTNKRMKVLDPIECSPEILKEYGFTFIHSIRPTPLDTVLDLD